MVANSGDVTLASYEAAAGRYRDRSPSVSPLLTRFMDRVVELVGPGASVLELGSGTGVDAVYLEQQGLQVFRTDACNAFVEMMRTQGHDARLLDVRRGGWGGPYDAIYANAVLLHVERDSFLAVLDRARHAVTDGGVLAFTLKEGMGEAWSTEKLDLPRHFTYWRASDVRDALDHTNWSLIAIDEIDGRLEPWLFVLARAGHGTPREA
jgi:SAM-dependent methyltransferase